MKRLLLIVLLVILISIPGLKAESAVSTQVIITVIPVTPEITPTPGQTVILEPIEYKYLLPQIRKGAKTMAIDTQKENVIESLVRGVGSLMTAVEFLSAAHQLITDAELTTDPPTAQELADHGFDWFSAADIDAALTAISNVRAVAEDDANRIPLNTLRRQV